SFVKDRMKNETVPIGVVAWSPDLYWHKIRFIKPEERLAGLQPEEFVPFLTILQDKLEHWTKTEELPYSEKKLRPFEDEWWIHVRKLLNHEIRLSEPKSFEAQDPRSSVELLYLAVTAQLRPMREQQKRLRRIVRKRLRDVFYRLRPIKWPGSGG